MIKFRYIFVALLYFNLGHCTDYILIRDTESGQNIASVPASVKKIGQQVRPGGLKGYLVLPTPPDACKELQLLSTANITRHDAEYFILTSRFGCDIETKIQNVLRAGYEGLIITNENSNDFFPINTNIREILTLSIGKDDGRFLENYFRQFDSLLQFDDIGEVYPRYQVSLGNEDDGTTLSASLNAVSFGKCPTYNSVSDFSHQLFQGRWILAYQFHKRFLECQSFYFTPTSDNSMNITAKTNAKSQFNVETSAISTTVNTTNPGVLNWSWRYFPAFVDHVTVVDVDYNKHAYVQLCNDFGVFHVKYGLVFLRPAMLQNYNYVSDIAKGRQVLAPSSNLPIRPYTSCSPAKEKSKPLNIGQTISDIADIIARFVN